MNVRTKMILTSLILAGAFLLGIVWPGSAIANTQFQFCIIENGKDKVVAPYDETCVGPGRSPARSITSSPALKAASKTKNLRTTKQVSEQPAPAARTTAAATPAATESPICPAGFSTRLVIGDSFNDLNFMNTAVCYPAPAKGAQFSFARDGVADNRQWTAKGTVAQKLIWHNLPETRPDGPYLNLFALAPFVSFNRVANSNAKLAATQNVDVLSYGFSSEALYANVRDSLQRPWQIYLRARARVNSTFEGETRSWNTTFEIQPLSDAYFIGSNIPLPNIGYLWIHPMLRTQYFRKVGTTTDPIFTKGDEVLRTGPVVSISVIPQPETDWDPNKPAPAPQWLLNLTFSWYRDLLHNQNFQYWNPSFTYNITDNIGFSVAYERGKIEATGKNIDLATISLTIKN